MSEIYIFRILYPDKSLYKMILCLVHFTNHRFKFVNSFQDLFRSRPWEKNIQLTFDPFQQKKRSLSWVNINAKNCSSLQPGIPAENVLSAAQSGDTPSIRQLKFQNPKQYVARQLNEKRA